MYRLEVVRTEPEIWNHPCWSGFCTYLESLGSNNRSSLSFADRITTELAKFNAINEFNTNYLLFETEEDATNFVLRWS